MDSEESERVIRVFEILSRKPHNAGYTSPCSVTRRLRDGFNWYYFTGNVSDWTATKKQAVVKWLLARQKD